MQCREGGITHWVSLMAGLAVLLVGCATPAIPDRPQAEPTAIGLQLSAYGAVRLFSKEIPDAIYFARLDGNSLIAEDITLSNYAKGDRFYLLNAKPGTYLAVASLAKTPPVFQYGQPGRIITYFSRELVEITRVRLESGQLAFMGALEVRLAGGSSPGDEVQTHYRSLINPAGTAGGFIKGLLQSLAGDSSAWGNLNSHDNSASARATFMQRAIEDLAGQGWDGILKPHIKPAN